jgi:hypothetical protein
MVQAAQLSGALLSFAGSAGAAVSFGAQGHTMQIADLTQQGQVLPQGPLTLSLGTTSQGYGTLGFGVDVKGYDGGAGHLWMSLAEALDLVDPTQDPSRYYAENTSYLVAVVGDPNGTHAFDPTADAAYNGTGLHLLVLPLAPH